VGSSPIYLGPRLSSGVETQGERRPYSRREVVIIVIIIIVGAFILGNFNSTTTTLSSVSSGPLSISFNVVCSGYGEPLFYNSLDQSLNYSTYQYGRCYFGFFFSNGQQVNSSLPGVPTL
jgi:hypothetical protein